MTATAPTSSIGATTDMADAPDTTSPVPAADAGAAASARPTLRSQISDNPLLSFFGALIVVLLSAAIVSPHIRIDDINVRIDDIHDRIDRLQATMEARFAAQDKKIDELDEKIDAKFAELDARINQLDLKLTALIAALQMTGIVDASLEGSLDVPAPEGPDSPSTSDAP